MRPGRSIEPRLVWMFGSPRSGSTWLLNLLAAPANVGKLDEPGIGMHLGVSAESVVGLESGSPDPFRALDMRAAADDYFFADSASGIWAPPLRRLILSRLRPVLGRRRWLVIKEPHGSDAADLLMRLLPRSRMIFLLRDGRDVVDSELDAASAGGWGVRVLPGHLPVTDRSSFIRRRALVWLRRTEIVERAYDGHEPSLRYLVRYEELLEDPTSQLAGLANWLDLDFQVLSEAADALNVERVADRGPGKFVRAASPGLWRKNMTSDEQAILHDLMGSRLRALGYAVP